MGSHHRSLKLLYGGFGTYVNTSSEEDATRDDNGYETLEVAVPKKLKWRKWQVAEVKNLSRKESRYVVGNSSRRRMETSWNLTIIVSREVTLECHRRRMSSALFSSLPYCVTLREFENPFWILDFSSMSHIFPVFTLVVEVVDLKFM